MSRRKFVCLSFWIAGTSYEIIVDGASRILLHKSKRKIHIVHIVTAQTKIEHNITRISLNKN